MLFIFQNILIVVSMLLLAGIPLASFFLDVSIEVRSMLFMLSFAAVFVLMIIRPLADIFNEQLWLRKLVILRKGFGIFSASIIVGFMIDALITPGSTYIASMFTGKYFSLDRYVLFAHLGDITGIILLLTSNRFSQKYLKQNWKRIQRLSYVYFFAGGIYEAFALESMFALYAILLVTNLTVLAWVVKIWRKG